MKSSNTQKSVLTVDELAERWSVDRKTIYLQIQRNELPVMRIGRAIRVSLAVVESMELQGSVVERS